MPQEVLERLQLFSEKWLHKVGNEQQLSQPFLMELCEALGTDRPYVGDEIVDYAFERPVGIPGRKALRRIDLYKRDHFILEAKCGRSSTAESGTAPVRGTRAYQGYILSAYSDQARLYSTYLGHEPPPLLLVVDISEKFWIWRGIDGVYAPFNSPDRIDIPLAEIADETNAAVLLA